MAFVIDDDERVRELVAGALTKRGYKTESFQTAKAALASFDRAQPAVVFLDVALLQSDAIDVLNGLGERSYGGVVHLMSGGRAQLIEAVQRLGTRAGVTLAPPLRKPLSEMAILTAVAGLDRAVQPVS